MDEAVMKRVRGLMCLWIFLSILAFVLLVVGEPVMSIIPFVGSFAAYIGAHELLGRAFKERP